MTESDDILWVCCVLKILNISNGIWYFLSLGNSTIAAYWIPPSCQPGVHKTSQADNLTRTCERADFYVYYIMVIRLNRIELQRKSTLDENNRYEWGKLHLVGVVGSPRVWGNSQYDQSFDDIVLFQMRHLSEPNPYHMHRSISHEKILVKYTDYIII